MPMIPAGDLRSRRHWSPPSIHVPAKHHMSRPPSTPTCCTGVPPHVCTLAPTTVGLLSTTCRARLYTHMSSTVNVVTVRPPAYALPTPTCRACVSPDPPTSVAASPRVHAARARPPRGLRVQSCARRRASARAPSAKWITHFAKCPKYILIPTQFIKIYDFRPQFIKIYDFRPPIIKIYNFRQPFLLYTG